MIKQEGIDEALALINEIGSGKWRKNVGERFGRQLVAVTKPYPSKPPGSTYRRTLNLSRQWYSSATDKEVTVGNRATYSGWVQQRATQAWMHRQHGWPTVEDRFESARMRLFFERAVVDEVNKIARKHG